MMFVRIHIVRLSVCVCVCVVDSHKFFETGKVVEVKNNSKTISRNRLVEGGLAVAGR